MITFLEIKQWGLGYATVAHFSEESGIQEDVLAMRDTQEEAIAYATPLLVTLNINEALTIT